MLSGVGSTYDWWRGETWVGHRQGIINAVPCFGPFICFEIGVDIWASKLHGVKIYPQFADIIVLLADRVHTWIRVRAGRIGTYNGIGVVLSARPTASKVEDTADTK